MNKRNGWFLASGIISIIDAVVMGFLSFFFLIGTIAVNNIDIPSNNVEENLPPQQVLTGIYVFLIILFLLFMTAAIVCSVIYLKNSKRSFDEMHKHSASVVTAIVLSFLCCGWIVGLFAVLGYTMRPSNEYVSETKTESQPIEQVEPAINSDTAVEKLEQLKKLYDQGLISEEEFNEKKKSYLEKL